MVTVNEELFDSLIRHQIYLLRFSGSTRNKIYDILNASELDLTEKIISRLANAKGGLTSPVETKRLETLLNIIRNLRLSMWESTEEVWLQELTELSVAEADSFSRIISTVSPVVVDVSIPNPITLKSIVNSKPFEGRNLSQWVKNIASEDVRRIENQIRLGMTAGETGSQIAKRVVGSAKLKGVDGVTQITRNQAQAITRTAVNHIANQARTELLLQNQDLVTKEQYVATLDARTTAVCRANDGKIFSVGEGLIPPLHFNCRSLRVPVLNRDTLTQRPAKSSTEKMLLREFTEKNNLKTVTDRDRLPRGNKGKYDKFKRQRIRELTGQVPSSTTYQDWLTRQSREFQDDTLGVTKAKLFRDGGLKLDKFVNRKGDELTLSQLASREAQAFKAAGLNPEDFK